MSIALKNIKINHSMSEETFCFSATVYLNGTKMGRVSNRGCGGANEYEQRDAATAINEYAKTLPKIDLMGDGQLFDQTDEMLIGEILNEHLRIKEFQRINKKGMAVKLPDNKEGEWSIFAGAYTKERAAKLRTKHGESIIFLQEAIDSGNFEGC